MKKKIGIFCGNISTYHCPFFKLLSKEHNLIVMFGSKLGVLPQYNKEHKTTITYDSKYLLDGYKHIFLKNFFVNLNKKGFFSRINLTIPIQIYKNKFDYIIIYGYDTLSSWIALISCIFFKKKIIWRGEAIKGRKNSIIKNFLKKIILKIFFLKCDFILYACEKNLDYLDDYVKDKNKFQPFPCSVDNNYFRNLYNSLLVDKIILKKKYLRNENSLNLVYAGRLTERKNTLGIFKVINRLSNNEKLKIHIFIIGNGPQKKDLEDFAKANSLNSTFYSFMNHNELAEIFTISDYFCINSDYDASPKVINEAMNFALPIICKNTIGTSEDLIINQYNGYIYKNDDDLLNIFKKIINNSKEIKYEGINSQKILDNKFNYSNCLATLNNIIH